MQLLAKTLEGLEPVLAKEIEEIGGTNINILNRAVTYEGDKTCLYKSNMLLRTALRILLKKKEFRAKNEDELYNVVYNIPWESIMKLDETFAIDCTANSTTFTHSKYVALKTKDAIVDRFRDKFGKRPNVNVLNPTYRINIHVRRTTFTLSLDSSGDSLHTRGYRMNTVDAPLNEVLAAGLILLSGWDKSSTFIDPMCGSGTLLIEAYRIATNTPPQLRDRDYGYKKWKSYDAQLHANIFNEAMQSVKPIDFEILGYDKDLRSVKVTQQNLVEANLSQNIKVLKKDFFKGSQVKNATIITNPPYNVRLKEGNIQNFYKKIGQKFQSDYRSCNTWIFSGNLGALEAVPQEAKVTYDLNNGGIPSKMIKYGV